MKKLLLLLVILASSYQGYSQVKAGLKAGGLSSTVIAPKTYIHADYEQFEAPRLGYYVGTYTSMELGSKFSFRPELLLAVKGYNTTISDTWLDVKGKRRLYYINLPLLISYRPSAKLAVVAGPELGLLLRAEGKSTSAFGSSGNYQTFDSYERGDYGIAVGFNYKLLPALSLDFRFSQGVNQLTEYWGIKDTRNRALQVGLAYDLFNKK